MNGDLRPEDYELTFQLGLAFQLMLTEFTGRTEAAGYADLRPIHGLAFQALGPEGATGSELAARLGVTKQAAGQIVDYLEARDYVERRPHPAGGRRKLVALTEKGNEHMRRAGAILRDLEAELAAGMGETEVADLRSGLASLIRTMNHGPLPALRPVW